MVHEVEHRLKFTEPNTLEVEERVLVRVLLQHSAGGRDELVCLDLSLTTAHSDVKKSPFPL